MADGKKKLLYDIAIAQVSYIGASFSGSFNPATANPYRQLEVELLKTEEYKKQESKRGFDLLGSFLQKLAKNKKV